MADTAMTGAIKGKLMLNHQLGLVNNSIDFDALAKKSRMDSLLLQSLNQTHYIGGIPSIKIGVNHRTSVIDSSPRFFTLS